MPDDVGREDREPVALAVIECLRVERRIPGDLRAERHGWREPMLPSHCIVEVSRLEAGTLPIEIVEVLKSPGNVVHRRELVVEVSHRGPLLGRALDLTWIALREERRVAHRRER